MNTHNEIRRLRSAIQAGDVVLTVQGLLRALHNSGTFVYHHDGRADHVVSIRKLTQRLEAEAVRCRAEAA